MLLQGLLLRGSGPPAVTAPATRGPVPKGPVPGVTNRGRGFLIIKMGGGAVRSCYKKWGHAGEDPWRVGRGNAKPQLQEPGGRRAARHLPVVLADTRKLFPETVPATSITQVTGAEANAPSHPTPASVTRGVGGGAQCA